MYNSQFYSSAVLFESVACSRGEFVYDKNLRLQFVMGRNNILTGLKAGYRSASKSNYQLRVFMLPALNTVRKLDFYKLAFPF